MKKSKFLYTIWIILIMGCSSVNIHSVHNNDHKFKERAINEFIKTNLFKSKRVFTVDSLLINNEIVHIGIVESEIKIFAFIDEREKMPQCSEINNALFIQRWKDHKFDAQESIKLLKKYNILYDDTDENYFSFDQTTDDKLKGFDMFFCKEKSSIFKKVKSNKPFQHYGISKINCN